MPNWCSNKLEVTGHGDMVQGFAKECLRKVILTSDGDEKICSGEFLLSHSIPTPEALKNMVPPLQEWTDPERVHYPACRYSQKDPSVLEGVTQEELDELFEQHGHGTWYEYNLDRWGTKWDAQGTAQVLGSILVVNFETAWTPPVEWCIEMSKRYPELSISIYYAEGGVGFYGYSTYQGGKLAESFEGAEAFWSSETDTEDEDYGDEYSGVNPIVAEFLYEHGLSTGG